MDILDELNLSKRQVNSGSQCAFAEPLNFKVYKESANDSRSSISFPQQKQELPISIKQIKVKPQQHCLTVNQPQELNTVRDTIFAKLNPTIDYKKFFRDFSYFFRVYPLISLNNFKSAEKLFLAYFSNRNELLFRLAEFKQNCEKFTSEKDKFGKLSFDFKLKDHSLQITLRRSKLKGIVQYLSVALGQEKDFIAFTRWNAKQKKEELIRSKNPYKKKPVTKESLVFDVKVWQAFNTNSISRKHFMKSLDCIERNHKYINDFLNLANKKTVLNFIQPALFNKVSIKTDNHNTSFLNFRTPAGQNVAVKLTNFASSIVVAS
jgi:hypothetical protein